MATILLAAEKAYGNGAVQRIGDALIKKGHTVVTVDNILDFCTNLAGRPDAVITHLQWSGDTPVKNTRGHQILSAARACAIKRIVFSASPDWREARDVMDGNSQLALGYYGADDTNELVEQIEEWERWENQEEVKRE